jgi:Spy/CpxP family protein refolding chaperone
MPKAARIGTAAAVLILALSSMARAQPAAPAEQAPAPHAFGHRLLEMLAGELNLTDDQRAQVHQALVGHRAEIAAAIKPLIEKRHALRDAVRAEKPDEPTIKAAAADLGKALGDAAVVAARVRADLVKVLSPEQLDCLGKFWADMDQAVDEFVKNVLDAG